VTFVTGNPLLGSRAGLAKKAIHAHVHKILPGLLAQQRISAMSDQTIGYERSDDEIPAHTVSDETLEAAARSQDRAGSFTLSFCSGLSTCPA
jgi:hypothetical protein